MNRLLPRALMAPAVVTLILWMIVPLAMTIYFSFVTYNLMQPGDHPFAGLENFHYFVTDPDFWASVANTLNLIGSVVVITRRLRRVAGDAGERAVPGPRHRARAADLALLRHAGS
jgi:ABC-type sugar transport system permease subunit